jgi:hypothetical protein
VPWLPPAIKGKHRDRGRHAWPDRKVRGCDHVARARGPPLGAPVAEQLVATHVNVSAMKRFLRDNGLSVALLALFAVSWVGQSFTGWRHHNDEQRDHNQPAVSWTEYVRSGDFLESTFENWESEFLQMAAFLILSALLVQRGSAESKKPPGQEAGSHASKNREAGIPADAPGPVHRGGLALTLYKRSLSVVLLVLFAFSFLFHGVYGQRKFNEEAVAHGAKLLSLAEYLTSSTLWFESFQNRQSEFLSVGVLVVLSVFLRQEGSPESKPVAAPHAQTGA